MWRRRRPCSVRQGAFSARWHARKDCVFSSTALCGRCSRVRYRSPSPTRCSRPLAGQSDTLFFFFNIIILIHSLFLSHLAFSLHFRACVVSLRCIELCALFSRSVSYRCREDSLVSFAALPVFYKTKKERPKVASDVAPFFTAFTHC